MGISERREREKEAVRTLIIEAARDIVSEEGLDALSMRAIAERIEYSPGTIYLHFSNKDELIRSVVEEGFTRLEAAMRQELIAAGADANPVAQHRALGRGYAHFALDNPAYFRVMFELPSVAELDCPGTDEGTPMTGEKSWDFVVATVQRGIDEGLFRLQDAFRGAVIGWGLVHGLTSLFLSGHLRETVETREQFMALVEDAMHSLGTGLEVRPAETSADGAA